MPCLPLADVPNDCHSRNREQCPVDDEDINAQLCAFYDPTELMNFCTVYGTLIAPEANCTSAASCELPTNTSDLCNDASSEHNCLASGPCLWEDPPQGHLARAYGTCTFDASSNACHAADDVSSADDCTAIQPYCQYNPGCSVDWVREDCKALLEQPAEERDTWSQTIFVDLCSSRAEIDNVTLDNLCTKGFLDDWDKSGPALLRPLRVLYAQCKSIQDGELYSNIFAPSLVGLDDRGIVARALQIKDKPYVDCDRLIRDFDSYPALAARSVESSQPGSAHSVLSGQSSLSIESQH